MKNDADSGARTNAREACRILSPSRKRAAGARRAASGPAVPETVMRWAHRIGGKIWAKYTADRSNRQPARFDCAEVLAILEAGGIRIEDAKS